MGIDPRKPEEPEIHRGVTHSVCNSHLKAVEYEPILEESLEDDNSLGDQQTPEMYEHCCRTLTYTARNKSRSYEVKYILRPENIRNFQAAGVDCQTNSPIGCKGDCGSKTQLHLSLLRVCKQVHHEARPILYNSNTFAFADHAIFADFFDMNLNLPRRTTCICILWAGQKCHCGAERVYDRADRNSAGMHSAVKSIQLFADIQKCGNETRWINVLNAAPFVLPSLSTLEVAFDARSRDVYWEQNGHYYGFRRLRRAVIHVLSSVVVRLRTGGEDSVFEMFEQGWNTNGWGRRRNEKRERAEELMDVMVRKRS
ncbi:hypothetical protein P7C71_g6452, partial [Lecanoromycetidae sp. Uapishka_2]